MSQFEAIPQSEDCDSTPIVANAPPTAPVVLQQQGNTIAAQAIQTIHPWHTGCFDCFEDVPSCCEAMWCPWCQNSRQYGVLNKADNKIDCYSCMFSFGLDVLIGYGIGTFLLTCHNRRTLRQRYSLEGDDVKDCMMSFFCNSCATCQHHREMSMQNEFPGGFCVSTPYKGRVVVAQTMN